MKLICLLALLIVTSAVPVAAQSKMDSLKNAAFGERYYLQKSKQQKNLAIGCLVSGGALGVVGGFLWFMAPIAGLSESGNVDGAKRTGKSLTAVGVGISALSIPLFIASSKNKKNAVLYTGTSQLLYPVNGTSEVVTFGVRVSF